MYTAGIDVGAKTVKIVVTQDGKIVDRQIVSAGQDAQAAIEQAWQSLDTPIADIGLIVATGSGRKSTKRANGYVTEVAAASKGAIKTDPEIRTVVDVGAEEGRAIRIDQNGKVVDFAINEKCAAGAGAFTEAMARALEVDLPTLAAMSLKSTGNVAMNAQCAVFAESELVTLVHSNTPKEDMAKAIHDAISDRIVSMVRRVGMAEKVMLIGGVALNDGFVASLANDLETSVIVPQDPQLVSAYGAAILGEEGNYAESLSETME
ncbi:MAG: CoA activase [Proteobacteria bacterium]|nr:CoA activase [Pseudomonadota bacterium]MBU4275165.1 CoA activase [Pseudomonadota bacterium]MBU4383073.1 CoA activase [Pseudomonadota bacterium]MBU4605163.1 CoA activase [Pseudomonadota bacterium]MCG2762823.1 acyl-CoA dehydratase activase [Desulfarculaceae bacterium]